MPQNLYSILIEAGRKRLAKPAITAGGKGGLSYGDLDAWSGRIANLIRARGLVVGDRVLVQVSKSPMAIAVHLACLRAGVIYIGLNTAYTDDEVEYFLRDSRAAMIICDPGRRAALENRSAFQANECRVLTLNAEGAGELMNEAMTHALDFDTQPVGESEIACILYTSGTTGQPKGVMLSHDNLAFSARALAEIWGFVPDDTLLHPIPIFHAHGLFVACHTALLSGCTTHFLAQFDASALVELVPESTVMMAVPTIYERIVGHPSLNQTTCRQMRLFTSGSSALSPLLLSRFEDVTGHRIVERYGASETLICTSNPLHGERKAGSVGKALPGVDVRVADANDQPVGPGITGDVQVRGPNVFGGYWDREEETHRDFTGDGFFRQGDLGAFDDDGYLRIVGRTKELIISGGYNVYPREVELVIEKIDGVADVAVFGVPHPDFGEAVAAAIVTDDMTCLDRITGELKHRLASYKHPKRYVQVASLPRNAMGKVLKFELSKCHAELFSEQA